MKIAFIEPDGKGGLAHFAFELCQALHQTGNTVELITGRGFELAEIPKAFKLSPTMRLWVNADVAGPATRRKLSYRIYASARRLSRGLRLTYEWVRVTRNVLADPPDAVIFSEMAFPHLAFAPYLMRRKGIATSQICHEFTERDARNAGVARLALRLSTMMFRQFDHIFFLSDATRRSFLAATPYDGKCTSRIPHGSAAIFGTPRITAAALRHHLGIGESEPVFLYFGYIRPSKGIEDLLDAFARSAARNHARLVIAGHVTKYADADALTRKAEQLGLSDRVIFKTNYIPNDEVTSYFDMARAVVLPYRSASQSGVLHLAFGHARPVISTAVGGLSEDVFDGKTGILVPPQDADVLARAIDLLAGNEELARQLGERAKVIAETQFTWRAAAEVISKQLSAVRARRDEAPSVIPAVGRGAAEVDGENA